MRQSAQLKHAIESVLETLQIAYTREEAENYLSERLLELSKTLKTGMERIIKDYQRETP